VSITGDNVILEVLYRRSLSKIELTVQIFKSKAGILYSTGNNTEHEDKDGWHSFYLRLDSDVERVRLVANKRVMSTGAEFLLVNSLELRVAENNTTRGSSTTLSLCC